MVECQQVYNYQKIIGPWVFVHVTGEGEAMTFKFYILSRNEIIQLIYESNDWYVNKWHRNGRTVNLQNACGVEVSWLEGKGEEDNEKHEAFVNPLKTSSIDSVVTWRKIFDD